jgi:putative DNA primase/helicase
MTDETHASGETIYPAELRDRDWWVNWVLAYRYDEIDESGDPKGDPTPTKQPVDPESTGTANPCRWKDSLPDDEHPSTTFDTVQNWEGWGVGSDVPASDRVISDELGVGIIIPVGGGDGRQVTLIDWDDVRDPETGETHPLCAYALEEAGGWAEISQSGEGVHQFVFGTIPGGLKKYIRHIDDEPFVGDDKPAVEMYQSGRLTAMTGRHIDGTGRDVVEGDDLLTEIVARTQDRGNASTDTPTKPLTDGEDDYETPSREDVAESVRSRVAYDGDDPSDWEIDAGSSVKYAAVLRGREQSDELPNTANWELIGYAATLGKALGKSEADVRADLKAHPTPTYGYDAERAKKEVSSMFRKMEAGNTSPPSVSTLKRCGLLPNDYIHLDELNTDDTLSGKQKWEAWAEARKAGALTAESEVPTEALEYIARERDFYDFDALDADLTDPDEELPPKAWNRALWWVNDVWADEAGVDVNDDTGDATSKPGRSKTATEPRTWEDIRYIYDASKEEGRRAARTLLSSRYDVMTLPETETLRVFDEETGVFTAETSEIRGEIYDGLGSVWSTHELNEILAGLRQQNIVPQNELNASELDDPHICVENGVLNVLTRELKEHSPEYHFVDRVPVTYDPDADTAPYQEFVGDLVERDEDARALFEMAGHALTPDANERWKKFLILTGDADNGKSAFYGRVKALLDGPNGEERNTAAVKIAKMAQNRFSVYSLYGSMANIAGEIDGKKIRNTAAIKDITGGDPVELEPKGGDSFFDTVNTTLMFAANDPPILGDRDKEAIATRIVPVELPYTFVDDPEAPNEKEAMDEADLEAWLDAPEALSGFLNLALDGIERLEANGGDVSLPESPEERLRMYERAADPMREFGERCLENDAGDHVVKADITTIYKEFATAEGYELGSNVGSVLHDVLRGVPGLNYTESHPRSPDYAKTDLPLRSWDERKRVVDRVTLTEEGLKYAERAGIVVSDDEEPETEDENPGLNGLEPGRHTVEATVAEQLEPKPWLQGEGTLVDDGELLDYVARGDTDPLAAADEGDRVRITNAKVTTDGDGLSVLEVSGVCDVEVLPAVDDEQSSVDEAAVADGGDTVDRDAEPQYTQAVAKTVHEAAERVGVAYIIRNTEGKAEPVRRAIDAAREQGKITKEGDDKYTA